MENSIFDKENGLQIIINAKENGFYPKEKMLGIIKILKKELLEIDEIKLSLIKIEYCFKKKEIVNIKEKIKEEIIKINDSSKISFSFEIPDNIEPSFEYPSYNVKAYIRYFFEASITFNKQVYISSYLILIKCKAIIKETKLKFENNINVSSYFINRGNCSLIAEINDNYFTLDDYIILNIEINNEKCSLNIIEIKFDIIRELCVYINEKSELIYDEEIITKINKEIDIKKNERGTLNFSMKIEDRVKSVDFENWENPYQNRDIIYLMPTVDSNHIKSFYQLKITLYFDGYVTYNYRPRIVIPINVGHQSKIEYKMNLFKLQKVNFNNDIFDSSFDY
jgi:hypothetical protein